MFYNYWLFFFLIISNGLISSVLAETRDGSDLKNKSWNEIVEIAEGSEVNFFLLGGADHINRYLSDYIAGVMMEKYNIKLNIVPIADTVIAVNIVLSEKESGVNNKGSIDMIWINGENFKTMKQADLAWCGYINNLPNNKLVNWNNPAIANDFGVPVDELKTKLLLKEVPPSIEYVKLGVPPKTFEKVISPSLNPLQLTPKPL